MDDLCSLLTPLCPTRRWVGMMPGGLDRPSCPGERERERERERNIGCPTLVLHSPHPDTNYRVRFIYARGLDRSLCPGGRERERERDC